MRKTVLLVITTAIVAGGSVFAAEPSYSFIEAGGIDVDFSTSELESDGWFAGFSADSKHFHGFGQYSDTSGVAGIGDTRAWNLGGGWHGLFGERADLVLEASYIDVTVETGSGKVGDNGLLGSGGVRWRIIKFFEINGFVNYLNLSDAGSDTGYEINALLYLGPIGIGAGWASMDVDTATVYLRWNFKRRGR